LFVVCSTVVLLLLYMLDFHFDVRFRDTFSWMDPFQYYDFAVDFFKGDRPYDGFSLPSIFPFFLYPVMKNSTSIPASLWINMVFAALLVGVIHVLCLQIGIRTAPSVVAAAVLASPLMLGLSRELYVEFSLTAIVAIQFALWFGTADFRLDSIRRAGLIAAFSALLGVGFMTKMTYPLFFVFPLVLEFVILVQQKRLKGLLVLLIGFAIPAAAVFLIEKHFFPKSLEYYKSLGNTTIPIMRLLGPPELFSFESVTFYFAHIWKTMLFLLTPFLLLGLFQVRLRSFFIGRRRRRRILLWLWFLGPLMLLVFQPTKEPRHVAPCIVPAVLLIFVGIEKLPRPRVRHILAGLVLAVSVAQYLLVSQHVINCPYFLDRAVMAAEMEQRMAGPNTDAQRNKAMRRRWAYSKNIVIAGFQPNAALALAWHFFPGIVYDLGVFEQRNGRFTDIPYERFEDLYTFASFNIYNRRCNWFEFYDAIDKQTVLANADYVLLKGASAEKADKEFRDYTTRGIVEAPEGDILILEGTNSARLSYRTLYARRFLREGKTLEPADLDAIHFEMFMAGLSRRKLPEPDDSLQGFPAGFRPSGRIDKRYIYFYGGYNEVVWPWFRVYANYLRRLYSGGNRRTR